ncbi:FlgD immunoglobulin-like domain containing protein [Nocardioides conyzicola]|uniref:FlgD/Vpr Ig-like domain-containing protein n=1 Tax=Nocardioides conyzicola TaxID=1651781 RepID=A0ABP8XV85_9ACTN
MFRRVVLAACGAVLLVGSALSAVPAEAGVSRDRPPPLITVEKFRHDFSPDRDGYHDQLKIPVTLTRNSLLVVRVVDLDTKQVVAHAGRAICLGGPCRLKRGTHVVRWPDIAHVFDDDVINRSQRGRYRLTFGAETRTGRYETARSVVVTLRGGAVDLDSDADRLISPNGDGRRDRLRIGYDLEQSARVRAVVRSGQGAVVDQVRLGRLAAGHHTWTWAPSTKPSSRPADGSYSVSLVAVPPAHGPGAGRAGITVRTDTVGPDATPDHSRTTVYPATTLFADEVRFQFDDDVAIGSLDVSVRRPDGALVRTLEPETVPCVPGDSYHMLAGDCALLRWDGRTAAGSYVLRARAYDAAGNQTVAETPLTVSSKPLVEQTKSTTVPASQWGGGKTPCADPYSSQGCGFTFHEPVPSERFTGGLSFRAGTGTAELIFPVGGETGHERFRVTATGGPTTPGDQDVASLSGTQMQGDGSFTTGWHPVTLAAGALQAEGFWVTSTSNGNDYDVASFTVEQTYFAPAS